jgi:hypothetical protein
MEKLEYGDYYQLPPIQDDNKPMVYFFDTLLYKSLSIRPFLFEINHSLLGITKAATVTCEN